jgi:hypothetical protein
MNPELFSGWGRKLFVQEKPYVSLRRGFNDDTSLLCLSHKGQSAFQLVRFEPERAGFALVGHASSGIDQVQSIRPASVGLLRGIAEFVQHGRNLYAEFSHARTRDQGALLFAFWAGKNHVIFDVALHLPNVIRVGFSNVDDQKRNLACVLFVELVECGNLPPEWGSSVASEYEYHGTSLSRERR